tara:strand:- start:350 stop:550 length:201 start_codon:yes stop_codon:yes gene_type:complete
MDNIQIYIVLLGLFVAILGYKNLRYQERILKLELQILELNLELEQWWEHQDQYDDVLELPSNGGAE